MTQSSSTTEDRGAVARLWLDRPAQRNAQSEQLLTELDAALPRAVGAPGPLHRHRRAAATISPPGTT